MKNCSECNYIFTFRDRLKALFIGHLKCKHCNSSYESKVNIYRGIYIFIVLMSNIFIFNHVIILNDFLTKIILQISIIIITFTLFDLLPHRWHKYKKIN